MKADDHIWLSLLEDACARFGTSHLDIIINQSGCSASLLPSVKRIDPPLPCYSLFTGRPEEGLLDIAPLLVRVDLSQPLHTFWLRNMTQEFRKQSLLLALVSYWRFDDLGEHLSQCLEAVHAGRSCMIRFFDPRVFALLFSDVLPRDQQQRWLQPALLWSWLDLDGEPQRVIGTGTLMVGPENLAPLAFDDGQADAFSCASDAFAAMTGLGHALNPEWTREQRFRACFVTMREASTAGLCTTHEREGFLLERLSTALLQLPKDRA